MFVDNVKTQSAVLREGAEIVFGGGGNKTSTGRALAFGERRNQKDSEFIYHFSYNLPPPIPDCGSKRHQDDVVYVPFSSSFGSLLRDSI